MNAIFRSAFEKIERLSPEAQKTLASELEQRAHDMWVEAELERGEASGGEKPMKEVFDRLAAKYGG